MSKLTLPRDLIDRGFRLIVRENGTLFAVSRNRGCSLRSRNLAAVIKSARAIAAWVEYQEQTHD